MASGAPGARFAASLGSASKLLRGVALLLCAALGSGCAEARKAPPDRVVLVTIDTLRADRVGAYGDARARTPVLDTLAAHGVRFETAISPAPLTLPAHASLLTALDPPRHAVRHNSIHRLDDGIPTLASALSEAGFATAAFLGAVVLERRYGLARGFDLYDDQQMDRQSSQTVGYAERSAEHVVDAALRWLETAPPRFFVWVHFYDPHAAYAPPSGFAMAFARDPYRGEIAFADFQLGRLLDALRARFGAEGLLVAVTSDHGESLGEHGEPRHSYGVYDATQRVPLILHGVGMPAGRVVETPVRLVDLAPTLLEAVGLPALPDADGRPLQPLIAGRAQEPRPAYVETFATRYDYGWSALQGLRTERYKYIRAPRPELYDLQQDPGERNDLAAGLPEVAGELEARLAAALARPGPTPARVTLDPAAQEQLRALGYVAPETSPEIEAQDPLAGPDPKDAIVLLQRLAEVERLTLLERPAEALALLRDLPDPPTAVVALRAATAFKAGDLELAQRDARRAIEREPRRLDVRLLLASAVETQAGAASAREAWEAAARLDPRSHTAWQGIARALEQQGDAPGAARARARAEALAAAESPAP
jgi:arylsulfatase A-like enzyme